jgi:hypothetical protein
MALSASQKRLIDELLRSGGSHSVADVYRWLQNRHNVLGATSGNIRTYLRNHHVCVPRSKPLRWRTSSQNILYTHYSSPK